MQFDDFYRTIGDFGPYQQMKYFLICLTYMLPPIMVYSWSFTAATPSFSCQISGDLSTDMQSFRPSIPTEDQCRNYQSQISVKECQRCFQVFNTTEPNQGRMVPCRRYEFNRTYYQSTLVEEVKIYSLSRSLQNNLFGFSYFSG